MITTKYTKKIKFFLYFGLFALTLSAVILYEITQYFTGYHIAQIANQFIPQHQPFFSTADLTWCKELRSHTSEIKAEYDQYLKLQKKSPTIKDVERIMANYHKPAVQWKVIVLRIYNRDTINMKYFPHLKKYLELVPGCSIVLFSILEPGKIIKPHTGPYRGVLRYHLALETPPEPERENCKIFVNNIPYSWKTGEDVLFDDTYLHYVVNNTQFPRVVLFLDVERPLTGYKKHLHKIFMFLYKYNITVDEIINNVNNFIDDGEFLFSL